jgi:hypothetical protein
MSDQSQEIIKGLRINNLLSDKFQVGFHYLLGYKLSDLVDQSNKPNKNNAYLT